MRQQYHAQDEEHLRGEDYRPFPGVHIDTASVATVGQAGGVLLTETIRAAGLGRDMFEALSALRKPSAA